MRLKLLRLIAAAGLAAALMAFALLCEGTSAGWGQAIVQNATDNSNSGALAVRHSYQSTSCTAGPAGTASACSGNIAPASSPPATGTATATDSISNTGTITGNQLSQTVRVPSCGPVGLANSATAADPLLARYQMAFRQTDPWGTTSSVTFSGTGYAADIQSTSTATLLGSAYSLGAWFKVANGYSQGGGLIALSTSPANTAAQTSSPMLWMDNSGKINFRVTGVGSTAATGVSTTAYNDGKWHLAVLSRTSSGTLNLFVDAAAAVQAGAIAALTGGTGYWHVGSADFTGITTPASRYLQGSVSGAFVRTAATTSGQQSTLYQAASASSYSTAVQGLGSLSQLWMLGDSGTSTVANTLPTSMTSPCSKVDVVFSFINPTDTISTQSLAALANNTPRTVAAPGPASPQSLTIATSRGSGYSTDIGGLHLYAPITFQVSTVSSTGWTLTFSWSDAGSAFLG